MFGSDCPSLGITRVSTEDEHIYVFDTIETRDEDYLCTLQAIEDEQARIREGNEI